MGKTLFYWGPALFWSALILAASTAVFSADQSGGFLRSLVLLLLGHPLPDDTFHILHYTLRKLGHLIAYGILGALYYRALRGGATSWRLSWSLAAVACALLIACFDEALQSLHPARTGSPADVVIDGAGATLAQIMLRRRNLAPRPVLSSKR